MITIYIQRPSICDEYYRWYLNVDGLLESSGRAATEKEAYRLVNDAENFYRKSNVLDPNTNGPIVQRLRFEV